MCAQVHGLWEELQIRPPPPHAERRWDRALGHFYEVLPVYIFDVAAKDAVLLDRNQQVCVPSPICCALLEGASACKEHSVLSLPGVSYAI